MRTVTIKSSAVAPDKPKKPRATRLRLRDRVPVQPDGYFRRVDLARRYRVSLVTIWTWTRTGHLPHPVQLGPNTVAWPVRDILAWEAARPTAAA